MSRKPTYLTVEIFEKFKNNDFFHLRHEVATNKRLLWILLGGLFLATVLERLFN